MTFFLAFCFISKTFYKANVYTEDRVRSKETTPTAYGWENFPAHDHCLKWNSFITQLIWGLTSTARMPRGLAAALPGQGFVWLESLWEGLLRISLGPLNNLHVNDQTKDLPTPVARAPLGSKALGFTLFSPPRSLESAGCQQASGKLIMRDLSPSSSPEPR